MTKHLTFILFLFSVTSWSQTEFFNSKINFSESELDKFYSSFSIDSSQVYFNANDYYVHAYDKETGVLNWSHYLANKTNNAPIPYQNNLFVSKHLSEYNDKCVQLNAITGDTIQTLLIESINTKPVFNNNIMYCSGIDAGIGGAVIAYDLKKNNVIWEKFIAHGVDKQPYFMKDKIIANAEDDNWFELDYNGKLLDTTCEYKANLFVEDIKCVRNFKYLTHNQKELSGSYFESYENIKVKYSKDQTIVLGENKMLIINNRNKIEKEIKLEEIITIPENQVSNYTEILKVEDSTVWFFHQNILVVYDFKNNKTIQTFDLTQWNVNQAILEDKKLWLISRNDGQLIGLELGPDPTEEALRAAKAKLFKQTHQCGNEVEAMNEARKKALETVKK